MEATCSTASSSRPRFIDQGRIELVSVIGNGAYGVVYLGIDYKYPQPVYRAVKQLSTIGLDERQRRFQRREIALHALASTHPSIIRMDRLVKEDDCTYVIMDYGSEGDLFAMITDRQRYVGDNELVRSVFLQILDGVQHLHDLGIAHRDIKPENIVCSDDGTRVRIVDFGLASSEPTSSEFGCGSTFYIAPECLGEWDPSRSTYQTRPADVWSLGVILVNLVCGRNPWRCASPSDESFNAYLADPNFLRRILPISQSCLYVFNRIFTLDPEARCTLTELRKLVSSIDSFTMDEEELRMAHASARAVAIDPVPKTEEEWSEGVFAYDDTETPSLRADSESPSPPTERSSRSSTGSFPATPLLGAETDPLTFNPPNAWEVAKDGTVPPAVSPKPIASVFVQ